MKLAKICATAFFLSAGSIMTANAGDVEKPGVIDFGESVKAMEAALAPFCSSQSTRETERFFDYLKIQHQIDCEGFEYFGAARNAEFVFGDDQLMIVWILTEKSDEAALEQAFRGAYGEPSHLTADFTAFADHNAAVRKDVPEALYYGDSVADQFRGWFDSQSGQ